MPSNDFGNQEPGTEAEIESFCEIKLTIDFTLTEKVHVTGDGAHPFYVWALGELGPEARPRGNFHKYPVGPDGKLVGCFPTGTEPTAPGVMAATEAQVSMLGAVGQ